jgi:hypothetical protein
MLWRFERGYERHPDLLRQNPTSLFILLGWSSISMASLTMRSMYRVFMARTEVSWNRMLCPESMQCSATADLSGCSSRMCRWRSGCHVVSSTDPHGRILGFLDQSRYCFFQVAPQLYPRGQVDPDPLLFRKFGCSGNRTRDLWICSQELWPLNHRGCQLPTKVKNN